MLDFPVDRFVWALFKGKEQEGPLQGAHTLFIVGTSPPIERIYHYLDLTEIKSLYFGAGGRFDYNIDTVFEIVQNSKPFIPVDSITIETPHFDIDIYLELRKRNIHHRRLLWIIPYIWKGTLLQSGLTSIEAIMSEAQTKFTDVFIKVDTGTSVFITDIRNSMYNSFISGYDEDAFLESKEKICV